MVRDYPIELTPDDKGTRVEVKILLHRRLRAAGLSRADLQRRLGGACLNAGMPQVI